MSGQAFKKGHAQAASDAKKDGHAPGGHGGPAATNSEIWGFEVVQHVTAKS